jgi:hypothetical protein
VKWRAQYTPANGSAGLPTAISAALIPDIDDDPLVRLDAGRPTFVKRMAMIPIRTPPSPAIGVYCQTPHVASRARLETLAALALSALVQVNGRASADRRPPASPTAVL